MLRPWRAKRRGVAEELDEQRPSLFMLVRGRVSPNGMLDLARRRGGRVTWLLRAAGAGLMWLGGGLLLSFLPALAAYLPFVGTAAAGLVGAAAGLASLGAAMAASTLIIAAAWARFRPLQAGSLAVAAMVAMVAQGALMRRVAEGAGGRPLSMGSRRGSMGRSRGGRSK
jgi:hypothetical protein